MCAINQAHMDSSEAVFALRADELERAAAAGRRWVQINPGANRYRTGGRPVRGSINKPPKSQLDACSPGRRDKHGTTPRRSLPASNRSTARFGTERGPSQLRAL